VKQLYRRVRDAVLRRAYDPRRYWTARGKTYMDEFPPCRGRSEDLIVRVLSELEVDSLLDVGCGYGRYLKAARTRLALCRLCGADISPTQIEHAREYLAGFPDVELVTAPATQLPFPDRSFDAVLTYGLMIHLRPAEAALFLEEAKRVGRRWGLFLEASTNLERPYLNPYYFFAHDYGKLFAKHRLPVSQRHLVNPQLSEFLYVVALTGGGPQEERRARE
jgi:ubiquinone/menaquinone biosynthesis C-methylase UbiE